MLCGYLDPNVRTGDIWVSKTWMDPNIKNLTLDPYARTMDHGRIGVEFRTFDLLVFGEKTLWKVLEF